MAKEKQHANASEFISDREMVFTRLIHAPRELVFKVWTDPKHVEVWFGPTGFTNTIQEMNVKPGGVWRFIMHGPDGTDYTNKVVFIEVRKPERLVYWHSADVDDDPNKFHVTVTFEAQGKNTLLTMRSVFTSAEAFNHVKKFGAIEGAVQHLNRLEEYLAKTFITE